MLALKGKAEGAVKSDKKCNLPIMKYTYVLAHVLDTLDALMSRNIKCGSEPRGLAEARCACRAIRSSLNCLHCSASPCAGTQVFCTVWAQPLHLSAERRTDA